jgi:hypothetical protein
MSFTQLVIAAASGDKGAQEALKKLRQEQSKATFAVAAAGGDATDQRLLGRHRQQIAAGTVYHGTIDPSKIRPRKRQS